MPDNPAPSGQNKGGRESTPRSAVVREWLTKNKIFFETTATLMLSTMAIILSWNSLQTSKTQARVQIAQAQPIFVVQSLAIRNDQTKKFDDLAYTVRNIGAAALGFSETVHSFIAIRYTGPWAKNISGTTFIPIHDYLPIGELTGDSTGLLCTLKGSGNNAADAALTDAVDKRARELKSFARMSVFSLFDFQFVDILGSHHRSFYRVDYFGGSPIDETEALHLLELENKHEVENGWNLGEISPDDVLRKTPLLSVSSHDPK